MPTPTRLDDYQEIVRLRMRYQGLMAALETIEQRLRNPRHDIAILYDDANTNAQIEACLLEIADQLATLRRL